MGGGELPEFLESIYKIDTGSDHVAKFRGDRPRELGDYAMKKKKNITSILYDLPYYRTGRSHNLLIMPELIKSILKYISCISRHNIIR